VGCQFVSIGEERGGVDVGGDWTDGCGNVIMQLVKLKTNISSSEKINNFFIVILIVWITNYLILAQVFYVRQRN